MEKNMGKVFVFILKGNRKTLKGFLLGNAMFRFFFLCDYFDCSLKKVMQVPRELEY